MNQNPITKSIKMSNLKAKDYHLIDIYADTSFTIYNKLSDLTFGFGPHRESDLEEMMTTFREEGYVREKITKYKTTKRNHV